MLIREKKKTSLASKQKLVGTFEQKFIHIIQGYFGLWKLEKSAAPFIFFFESPDDPSLPTGDFLGQLKNELDKWLDSYISKFVCSKFYNYEKNIVIHFNMMRFR